MNSEDPSRRSGAAWVALLLVLATLGVYLRVLGFELVNYDDPEYVTDNRVVAGGLTAPGLVWACTSFHAANWHPLTWLSLMLDVELGQLLGAGQASVHHAVNLALHALNACLLFFSLQALTRRLWPSAIAAALFALHPLRVESVAWVSERKDLLAGTFFLGMLLAYASYARSGRLGSYLWVVLCLVLGLLAKPMLVTAPCLLLLLDFWPLDRFARRAPAAGAAPSPAPTHPGDPALATAGAPGGFRLFLEKLPLFLIALGSALVTLAAQREGGAVGSLEGLGIGDRLLNAGAAYMSYLQAAFWPARLACFYPHPVLLGMDVTLSGGLGLALVLGLCLLALLRARSWPWLCTGWFWFAGMLVPVIGLVQVGEQSWADRYAYLPLIGLSIALVFGLAELVRARPALALPLGAAALAALLGCAVRASFQVEVWKDSRSLFEHALAVTAGNWIAHNNLGLVHLERRELGPAIEHFRAATRHAPWMANAHYNLGNALGVTGALDEAAGSLERALEVQPGHPAALLKLAALARASGDGERARALHERALEANPENPLVYAAFARVLLEENELDRAANCAASALELDPTQAEAELVLGEIALRRGELDEAELRLARASARLPDSAATHALLGLLRMGRGDPQGARAEFERALALEPELVRARFDLGALLQFLGEIEAARAQFQAVLDLVPGDPEANTALGVMLIGEKKPAEAIPLFTAALARKPDLRLALFNLAVAYEATGEWRLAAEHYEKALAIGTPDPDAARALAWILSTGPDPALLDGEKAVELATYAVQRQGARALEVLAAACARKGDFGEAVKWQQQALEAARTDEQRAEHERRLQLYRARQPYTRTP